MSKPDELWEKYAIPTPELSDAVYRTKFLAALREYGQAVRDRDAEICKEMAGQDGHGVCTSRYQLSDQVVVRCAVKILDEPLP